MRSKAFLVLVSALAALTLIGAPSGALGSPAPGSLDTNFSGDGRRTVAFGPETYSSVEDLAVYGSSRIVAAGGNRPSEGVSTFAVTRLRNGGALDDTFGGDGKVTTEFVDAFATQVATYGDQKIIVAGSDDGLFALARYRYNGELDPTFDEDGKVTTDLTAGEDVVRDIKVGNDGKILVAGTVASDASDVATVRYDVDGSLDENYGDGGKVLITPSFNSSERSCSPYAGNECEPVASTLFQDNGKLLVLGQYWYGCNRSIALGRYNRDGTLDETFHHDGRAEVYTPFVDEELCERVYWGFPTDLAIGPKGGIVVGGVEWEESDCPGCGWHMMVHRYTPDGRLDDSFSSDGVAYAHPDSDWSEVEAVAVQPDGKVLAAGYSGLNEGPRFLVARFTGDGKLDATFSKDGFADPSFEPGRAQAIALQDRGRFVVGGYSSPRFAIARYHR